MTRIAQESGWYCDLTVKGQWCALIRDSRVVTSAGDVPLTPAGNPLFLRMLMRDGVMYLAGQGHQDGAAWLWDGDRWFAVTSATNGQKVVAFGPAGLYVATSPHTVDLYDLEGEHIHTLPISPGSGGIQFVTDDGRVVLGDETYGRGPDVPPGVAEWSQIGDVTIGGGYTGGAIVNRRLLEPGDCYFIHAYRDGDQLAFSMVTPRASVFHWLTVQDLERLPFPTLPQPDPDPEPDPEPDPMPDRYEPVPAHLDVVQAVWNRCTPEQRAQPAFVGEATAWELRLQGLDYYVNQKRGTQGDSEDAISTPHPRGAGGWAIIDIIAGFRAHVIGAGSPAWIDQTQPTIDGGTVGGGRLPKNVLGGVVVPGPGTPPTLPTRPELKPILDQLAAVVGAVANLPACPPAPDCPPCPLPHGGGATLPVASEPELQGLVESWRLAWAENTQRILPPSVVAILLYRLYHEGATRDALVEDARARGHAA